MGVAKGPRVKLLRTVGEWMLDATTPQDAMLEPLPDSSLCRAAETSTQIQGSDSAAAVLTQDDKLAAIEESKKVGIYKNNIPHLIKKQKNKNFSEWQSKGKTKAAHTN